MQSGRKAWRRKLKAVQESSTTWNNGNAGLASASVAYRDRAGSRRDMAATHVIAGSGVLQRQRA
jgi:hypothetical protein